MFDKLLTDPPGILPCELAVLEVGSLASSQLVGETSLLLPPEGEFGCLLLGVGRLDDLAPNVSQGRVRVAATLLGLEESQRDDSISAYKPSLMDTRCRDVSRSDQTISIPRRTTSMTRAEKKMSSASWLGWAVRKDDGT